MPLSPTRVVITGLGVVCPLGRDLDSLWQAFKQGQTGISEFSDLPTNTLPVRNGGQAKCFSGAIEEFGPLEKNLQRAIKKNQKVMCREIELGVASCQLALSHAGLGVDQRDPERTGITYGCDYILTRPEEFADGIEACHDSNRVFHHEQWPILGMPKVNPLWLLKYLPNMPASHVAIFNDLRGPSNSLTMREASNSLTIGEATAAIRRGAADAMVVGATGSRIEPLRFLHVTNQEQIAKDRANPGEMCRPFDSGRDGIVLGEGSAAFVLESLEFAQKRGAKILGEIIATGSSAVGAAPGRDHIRMATKNVLGGIISKARSVLATDWHLHVAGRGDVAMDISESLGVRDVLGDDFSPPIVAAKSYFGSLGAGSAAVEVVSSCLAMLNGELFPTLNYTQPDSRCPIKLSTQPVDPGKAFVHLAYSPQGQASGVCIAKFEN
ncbi:MAG: beta-ketoacyl synthase N-terminal-like domain-containing protein [Pirellulaceae bacterium]|nr:beta-ketoacyl synthase N-terminal-like domain-containing protein [Pirellulaceae bacterium]